MTPQEALKAVCNVQERTGNEMRLGNGVFLAPNKVLTAVHILTDMREPIFRNGQGETALKLKGAKINVSMKKDLAIVTLDRNLSGVFCETVPQTQAQFVGIKGFLVSRRLYRPEIIDVEFNPMTSNFSHIEFPYHMVFNCASENIGEGYSGSPILDRQGRVISLVSAGADANADNQPGYVTNSQLNYFVSGLSGKKPFLGVTPLEFAKFMEASREP